MTSPRPSELPPIDIALRLLGNRPRSEQEVRRRLRRAGHAPAAIETVIDQLKRHGLLDDAAFAEYWVEQRQTFRPRGGRLLRAELRQHGIDAALADDAAANVEPRADADAYRAAAKRAAQLRTLDEPTFKTRLSQFLARRGFDWDTITPVVERLATERDPAEDQ